MKAMDFKDLVNKTQFTILLGRNGSGKSTILRNFSGSSPQTTGYISPERGGVIKYDPGVDNNMSSNQDWIRASRNQNRFENFRQQSAVQFRNLEVLVLREIEKNRSTGLSFDSTLNSINELLPAVSIVRSDRGFITTSKADGIQIPEESLSSGESELLSLAIEILVFSRKAGTDKTLLLDEPDVHLHPDLQQKLVTFIEDLAISHNFKVVIATHSTAIIGAFSEDANLQIIPISDRNQIDFESFTRDDISKEIIPIFGSHPLSSQFNKRPILLVEGDDDKRVFDQISRTSEGGFKFIPVPTNTVNKMHDWEVWLNKFLPSIYDDPVAYSLRDLDATPTTDIDDYGIVKRARLNCYSIENLLLTSEVLEGVGISEATFKSELQKWHQNNQSRSDSQSLQELIDKFDDRRILNIKNLRNVITAVFGTSKQWEVLLGQRIALASLREGKGNPNSLFTYLGDRVLNLLFSI